MSFRGSAQYGQNYRGGLEYVDNYGNDFKRGNFREMQNYRGQHHIEVDRETTIQMTILKEVDIGPGKDSIQVILEGMFKAVVVDQDQVQEPVLIEIELDVLNVGNMIILLMTVQTQRWKENQNKYSKCII